MRFLTSSGLSMLDIRINSLGVLAGIRRPWLEVVKVASALRVSPGRDWRGLGPWQWD